MPRFSNLSEMIIFMTKIGCKKILNGPSIEAKKRPVNFTSLRNVTKDVNVRSTGSKSVRTAEEKRNKHHLTIENQRRDVKAKATGWEESDKRFADATFKYDHLKREIVAVREKLREVEAREIDIKESLSRSREDHRLATTDCDLLKEDMHDQRHKDADHHRQIITLRESLRHGEETIANLKAESHTLIERNNVFIREGDEDRTKHGHLREELARFTEKLLISQAEVRIVTDAHDHHRKELEVWRQKYKGIVETITEFHDDSMELEFQIDSLRTLLRKAREQKDGAITARHQAGRDKNDWSAKYDEKCRGFESFEESASAHYRAHSESKGGSRSFIRTASTGTMLHHDQHSHGADGHGHSQGGGMFSSL